MAEKRRQYRVRPGSEPLGVETRGSTRNFLPLSGRIVDLSIGGIGAVFEKGRDPDLSVEQTACLRLASPRLEEDLLVPVRVARKDETGGGWTYGFQILDWLGLVARLPEDLAALFNRRGARRARPDPRLPIEVVVTAERPSGSGPPETTELTAILSDLSHEGVSLEAGLEALPALEGAKVLRLSFRIPEDRRYLTFSGRVRHRSLTDSGIRFGVGFDPTATPGFAEKQRILAGYAEELLLGTFALGVEREAAAR